MQRPAWTRSIRFRLAIVNALVVFAVGAGIVGVVYWGLWQSLRDEPVSRDVQIAEIRRAPGIVILEERTVRAEFRTLEQIVNQRTLDELQRWSLVSLAALLPLSAVVGYVVAGRALRPIARITAVAQDIQNTDDLSRRIGLEGPEDELKQLADGFDAMVARVERGVEDRRAFVQDISHELRNPLAVMATNLDVVLSDPDADMESLRATAEVVRRSVDRTVRTVDQLVTFARPEQLLAEPVSVELGVLVTEAIDEFEGPAGRRTITLTDRVDEAPTFIGDRDSLKRALGNLVANSVRLAPAGSTITVGAGGVGSWAWLGVSDQGPGIAADEHELVFRRFWQKGERSGEGGLGLAIVRQMAEAHRGVVTLDSEEGLGSSFVLWLPVADDAERAEVTADGLHPLADPLR